MSCHAAQQLDRLGHGDTWVHHLDSRSKLLLSLCFIVCVISFQKYAVAELVPFFLLPVVLGVGGRVPLRLVLRMLAVASPFAILAAAANPFLDRTAAFSIGHVTVTTGCLSFVSVILRFILTTGMLLVLVATTSLPGLLHGLVQLRMPTPFVVQVHFLYRYLFVLLDEGQRMSRARHLRDPDRRHATISMARQILSALLWKTYDRADRIYSCMRARGFSGDLPTLRHSRFAIADGLLLSTGAAACIAARFIDISTLMGQQVMRFFA